MMSSATPSTPRRPRLHRAGSVPAAWGAFMLPPSLLLRGEPFLHARSPIKHLTSDMRPRRPNAKHFPTIERARVSPQFGGEFFLR